MMDKREHRWHEGIAEEGGEVLPAPAGNRSGDAADSPAVPLVFVVSSGRCGSTAVSAVLRSHPRVLSLSEFFRCLGAQALESGHYGGAQFWDLLSRPRPHMTAMLRYRAEPPEIVYLNGGRRRFGRESGVPPVLLIAFPHLVDEPDALLDELHDFVIQLPGQSLPDHFRALFGWLCARFGREVVVERSGASLASVENLIRNFPEARFIHLYRDGRRVAESMSRHHVFRLWVAAQAMSRSALPEATADELAGPVLSGPAPVAGELAAKTVDERFEALLRAMGFEADQLHSPVWRFGALWTAMVRTGLSALAELDSRKLLTLDFDDLLARPSSTLSLIDDFLFDAPTKGIDQWITQSLRILRPGADDWGDRLSPVERRRLEIACRPGMKLIYGDMKVAT